MSKYAEFDAALIATIKAGKNHFFQINHSELRRKAEALRPDVEGWRFIDRRLQALRKGGTLTYERIPGWRVKE
jgi:hypothetical protein